VSTLRMLWTAAVLILGAVGAFSGTSWLHSSRCQPIAVRDRVRQWSVSTCGPAAVATILNAYSRAWSPKALERECGTTPRGSSLSGLRDGLRAHGLTAEAFRALRPKALERVPCPFVAYLSNHHFVVVERFRSGSFEVFDPAGGLLSRWHPERLFERSDGWLLAVCGKQAPK
jgi:ABC-type bacteriocin/lantibiotic exporter with double-glycine peptidase domain